jgi:hypothetical protein
LEATSLEKPKGHGRASASPRKVCCYYCDDSTGTCDCGGNPDWLYDEDGDDDDEVEDAELVDPGVERLFIKHQIETDTNILRKISFLNGRLLDAVTDRKSPLKKKLQDSASLIRLWPPGWEALPQALQAAPEAGLLAPFLRGGFDQSLGYARDFRPTPYDISKRAGHSAAVKFIIAAHKFNSDRYASANTEFFDDLIEHALECAAEAEAAAAAAAAKTITTSKGASLSAAPAVGGPVSTGAVASDPRLTSLFRAGGGGDVGVETGKATAAMAAAEAAQGAGKPTVSRSQRKQMSKKERLAFEREQGGSGQHEGSAGGGVVMSAPHLAGPPLGAGPAASAGTKPEVVEVESPPSKLGQSSKDKVKVKTLDGEGASELTGIPPA